MKTNMKLLIALALMATACTPGSKITSGVYSDDVYFTPGDAMPMAHKPVKEVKQPQQRSTVMMQVEENEQGKTVNNYVVPKGSRNDKNAYYFDDQPATSDTTLEYIDNNEQVTIYNTYQGDEMDYSTQLRTFYNPYLYDPFWDPFMNSYGCFAFNSGWGWNNPWFFSSNWGWGWGWGPSWGWGGNWGGSWNSVNTVAGIQNPTGNRGRSNAVRYGMNTNKSGSLSGSAGYNRQAMGRNLNGVSTRMQAGNNPDGSVSGTRQGTRGAGASATRQPDTRLT